MDATVQKICCVCGRDVRQRKRTRDPRGNYYCTPCYEARAAAIQRHLQESFAAAPVTKPPPQPVAQSRPAVGEDVAATALQPLPAAPGVRGPAPGRFWVALPAAAGALLALSHDRVETVRHGAVLGAAGLAVVGLLGCWRAGGMQAVARFDWRYALRTALLVGGLTILGAGTTALGFWRAGSWGGSWIGVGVLLSIALWLTTRSRQPGEARTEEQPIPPAVDKVHEPATPKASGLAVGDAVQVQRRVPRRTASPRDVRISDLLAAEALAEVEAVNARVDAFHDPEVPVSPIRNPPVAAIVGDLSELLAATPATLGRINRSADLDDPFKHTPFRFT